MKKTLLTLFTALCAVVAANAADAYKTLTFPDDNSANNSVSAYTKTWTATSGSDSWTITNFNNNSWNNSWTYIKCGNKTSASVASIASPQIDKAIGSVVVTIDKVTASSVNSIKLVVASDADFTTEVETVTASSIAKGDMTFTTTKAAANYYYKLVFDCAKGSSNGLVQVSKVQLYESGSEPEVVDISNTPETAYTVAKAYELIDAGKGLATDVYVAGTVVAVSEVNTTYNNATYTISDDGTDTKTLTIFRGKYLEKTDFTSEDQIKVGDKVVVYGGLLLYNSLYEVGANNYIYSLNGNTSGINTISAATATDGQLFNISGQAVGKSYKGIVIKNGKKYLQK